MKTGRFRAIILVAAIAVVTGIALSTPAHAVPNAGNNWEYGNTGEYINAWNGGPFVYVYNGATANGDFILDQGSNFAPTVFLVFANYGSNWSSNCIGDAYNRSGRADTSLDPCPTAINGIPSSGDGWGTHMLADYASCSNGYVAFKDQHWGGWLGPGGSGNGSAFYLNNPTPYCFQAHPAQ